MPTPCIAEQMQFSGVDRRRVVPGFKRLPCTHNFWAETRVGYVDSAWVIEDQS